jgi:hypothetical protein
MKIADQNEQVHPSEATEEVLRLMADLRIGVGVEMRLRFQKPVAARLFEIAREFFGARDLFGRLLLLQQPPAHALVLLAYLGCDVRPIKLDATDHRAHVLQQAGGGGFKRVVVVGRLIGARGRGQHADAAQGTTRLGGRVGPNAGDGLGQADVHRARLGQRGGVSVVLAPGRGLGPGADGRLILLELALGIIGDEDEAHLGKGDGGAELGALDFRPLMDGLGEVDDALEGVVHGPAGDDDVIGEDDEAGDHAQPAHAGPGGAAALEPLEGHDRLSLGGPADHDLGHHDRDAHQSNADKIDDDEQPAAVFARDVGELPDVAQTDGRTGRGEDEAQSAAPLRSRCRHGLLLALAGPGGG